MGSELNGSGGTVIGRVRHAWLAEGVEWVWGQGPWREWVALVGALVDPGYDSRIPAW